MKKYNRFIAAVLAVWMGFSAAAYAVEDDVPVPKRFLSGESASDNSDYKCIYDLLSYLGFIDEPQESFDMAKKVTRAYGAKTMAKILTGTLGEKAPESPYKDVSTANEYASGIYTAKQYGVLEEGKNFYPDRGLTYVDLAKWLLRALHYEIIAQDSFAYAEEHGVFEGIAAGRDKEVTYRDFFAALENAVNMPAAKTTIDADGTRIEENENETYLSKRDIFLQKGVVTGVYYMNFDPDKILAEDEIEINKRRFRTTGAADIFMMGKAVCAYADCGDDGDRIICMWENTKATKTWEILPEDFESFSDGKISAFDGKKNYRIKIDSDAAVFCNGVYHDRISNVGEEYLEAADKLEITDNDGDNSADAVFVHVYYDYPIDGVSGLSGIIAFMYGGGSVKADSETAVNITLNKAAAEIGALQKYNIATVEEISLKNGEKIYNIVVSQNAVNGTVSGIGDDEKGDFYEIDGEKYYLSKTFKKVIEGGKLTTVPQMGKSGDFYLSADGYIAGVKMSGEFEYAYVTNAYEDEETEKYFIKAYTDSGKIQSFELSEKVKFYSPLHTGGARLADREVYNSLVDSAGKTQSDIVVFKTKDGKITELALPLDRLGKTPGTVDYPLTKDYVCGSGGEESRLYMSLVGAKYYVGSTTAFEVPQAESLKTNEKAYKVKTKLTQGYSSDYYFEKETVTLYNADKFYVPEFATVGTKGPDTSTLDANSRSYMIQKVERGLNEDDEEVIKIYFYSGGNLVSRNLSADAVKIEPESGTKWYGTEGGLNKLSKGDIIQFEANALGEIESVRVLVSYKNIGGYRVQAGNSSTVEPPAKTAADMPQLLLVYGKVVDRKDNNILLVNVSDSGKDETYQESHYISTVYGQNTYTLLDTDTMEVSNSQNSEILPGDTVILKKQYSQVCDIYIIR